MMLQLLGGSGRYEDIVTQNTHIIIFIIYMRVHFGRCDNNTVLCTSTNLLQML